jgi:uncharacterized protein YndB with AHSA1/START domain
MTYFGTISLDGSTAAVRFERRYAASARELWSALTDADRMRRWLGAAVSIEGRVGGAVRLRWDSGDEMRGVITAFEPGRLLEYTWCEPALGVESVVRFELRAEPSGTVLVLEHTQVPADQRAGFGAGWHGHLDALAAALEGRSLDPHERERELRPEYASRSGTGGSR